MNRYIDLLARLLMAQIFILAGLSKIIAYTDTQAYMQAMGVPGMILPLVIALEVLGGLALLLGFKTRLVALLLAVFSVLAAMLFHASFTDQMQMILFMKNLAMAGGLLLLYGHGASGISIDRRLSNL